VPRTPDQHGGGPVQDRTVKCAKPIGARLTPKPSRRPAPQSTRGPWKPARPVSRMCAAASTERRAAPPSRMRCDGLILIEASSSAYRRSRLALGKYMKEEAPSRRFYTKQRQADCGIDPHAKTLYVCVLTQPGSSSPHHRCARPDTFLCSTAPSGQPPRGRQVTDRRVDNPQAVWHCPLLEARGMPV
jgi:hypothetical protein